VSDQMVQAISVRCWTCGDEQWVGPHDEAPLGLVCAVLTDDRLFRCTTSSAHAGLVAWFTLKGEVRELTVYKGHWCDHARPEILGPYGIDAPQLAAALLKEPRC